MSFLVVGQNFGRRAIVGALWAALAFLPAAALGKTSAAAEGTRLLVVAPDRGFHGNSTIEERFAEYRETYSDARLFFMTERLQRERLEAELQNAVESGRRRIVLLPVVVSVREPGFQAFVADLEAAREALQTPIEIETRPAFGRSAAAAHILADHALDATRDVEGAELVVLGSRARDEASEVAIREALENLTDALPLEDVSAKHVEVLFSGRDDAAREHNESVYERIAAHPNAVVVPFFLDFRADVMMSVDAAVSRALSSKKVAFRPVMPDEHEALSDWMQRESARALPPTAENLGVVLLAHGSDRIWNEEVRRTLEPLTRAYDTEFSFNMADGALLGEAVRALEARGRTHVVIYRLFGLESSFAGTIERMIAPEIGPSGHDGHGGHGGPSLPISSRAHVVSFGGIEDSPLFAEALLARAEAMSQGDRSKEVVLLVAHGAGADRDDSHWRSLLQSLGRQMQERADPPFHDVAGATLREDWPEAREAALAEIVELVERHRNAGRRVLAVEARLNGPGPTGSLLDELALEVNDEGFVPHPNVSRLVLEDLEAYLANGALPNRFSSQ